MKNIVIGAIMAVSVITGVVATSAASEAAFGPGISQPTYQTRPPSSTNPGPCITFPSGRVYCGS